MVEPHRRTDGVQHRRQARQGVGFEPGQRCGFLGLGAGDAPVRMQQPALADDQVAPEHPLADDDQPQLAIEAVGIGEIDELAGVDRLVDPQRNVCGLQLFAAVQPYQSLAAMSAGRPQQQRKSEPGLQDCCDQFAPGRRAQPHRPWDPHAGDRGQQRGAAVAPRSQHRARVVQHRQARLRGDLRGLEQRVLVEVRVGHVVDQRNPGQLQLERRGPVLQPEVAPADAQFRHVGEIARRAVDHEPRPPEAAGRHHLDVAAGRRADQEQEVGAGLVTRNL